MAPGVGADGLVASAARTWLSHEFALALLLSLALVVGAEAALRRVGAAGLSWRLRLAAALLLPLPLVEVLFFRCPLWALLAAATAVAAAWPAPAVDRHSHCWRGSPARVALAVAATGLSLVPWWPAVQGDEPHYLLIAHSVWQDGDLDVADEYAEGEYRALHPAPLSPHYRPGLVEGSRYSMHGAGYGIALLPAYALGQLLSPESTPALERALQVLVFAWFAATLWRLCVPFAGATASTAAVLLACALGPLLLAPLHLFPETLAMALSCSAFLGLWRGAGRYRALLAGMQLAALPWLGVKYLPLAATVLVFGIGAREDERSRRAAGRTLLLAGAPLLLALLGHGWFTLSLYGSWSPSSVYLGADPAFTRQPGYGSDWVAYLADWPGALRTLIGYFLDQREGLLAVGPQFLLAAAGLPLLWRRSRRFALATAAILAAHLGPYALSQQLGGHSPPARPVMAVAWALVPAVALGWSAAGGWLLRGAQGALAMAGACLTTAFVLDPTLLPHDYGVTRSWLLQRLAPAGSELWRAFPSWLSLKEGPHWLVTLAWLAATVALAAVLARQAAAGEGRDSPPGSRRAGAIACLLAASVVCAWAATLVVTARHRGASMGEGVEAFVVSSVPEQAWAEPGGVWVAPGDLREVVLVTRQSPGEARFAARTLVDSEVRVGLRGAWRQLSMRGGKSEDGPLSMGPGWNWRGQSAVLLAVGSSAGASPAEIEGGEDHRRLGVFLRLQPELQPSTEGQR